jgi:hypothetical protein
MLFCVPEEGSFHKRGTYLANLAFYTVVETLNITPYIILVMTANPMDIIPNDNRLSFSLCFSFCKFSNTTKNADNVKGHIITDVRNIFITC